MICIPCARNFLMVAGNANQLSKQEMAGPDARGEGLGHQLYKDIGCLAGAILAPFCSVGASIDVRALGNQTMLLLAGVQQRTRYLAES